ncbi:MAG: DUF3320 domain-containing protein [Firmicutes bacterium]|nr:DUF3320 domain-containing protein [Bacillota bacterium]
MNNKISLNAEIQNCINFPVSQTNIPLVKRVRISNLTYENLENLTLVIKTDPVISEDFSAPINYISADSSIEVSPVAIKMDLQKLLSIKEKIEGKISFTVLENDEVIFESSEELTILSFRQWTGVYMLPELICAYIVSTGMEIESVIMNSGMELNQISGSPYFRGYDTDNPEYVKSQMKAIFNTLFHNHIAFDENEPNYEDMGITIRFPTEVLKHGAGNILDMSLLYSACLEKIGLHPILIFFREKVIVGCWLEKENFSECIQENIYSIKNRIQGENEEIRLVDCSVIYADEGSFEDAETSAEKLLEKEDDFLIAIDVKRGNLTGFTPLPLTFTDDQILVEERVPDSSIADEFASAKLTKQQMWERKLLDLSLRNMLLNFRVMRNSIQIISPVLSDLEDAIAEDKEFKIAPVPNNWQTNILDGKIYSSNSEDPDASEIVLREFNASKLLTFENAYELENRMKYLARQAKLSIEENGSNTLYLALGFLKWYETDTSEKARYAPLVLIPVDLTRKILNKSYSVKMRDEDPQMNITLLEYLRQEYQININGLDELPLDEHGVDLNKVFRIVSDAISVKRRWQVEELSFIGLFSFSQYIMWNDIKNRMSDIEKNPVVASLISGKMEWTPDVEIFDNDNIDKEVLPSEMAVPLSADSSQLKAVYAASQGQSFVLHGPPGTGKSQTISNIISNALYNGKTVLFVAEKMAALSVVENRLNSLGLGDFCLEIHSNKANKKNILSQLEKTLNAKGDTSSADFEKKADEIYKLRSSLNEVMEELHKEREFGFSLYDAIVMYENTSAYAGKFKFLGRMVRNMNKDTYFEWRDLLYKIKAAGAEYGELMNHPLQIFESRDYSVQDKVNLMELLPEYADRLNETEYLYKNAEKLLGLDTDATFTNVREMEKLIGVLERSGEVPQELIADPNIWQYSEKAQNMTQSLYEFQELRHKVLGVFNPSVFRYNYLDAYERWLEAEKGFSLTRSGKQKKLVAELKEHTSTQIITKENIKDYYQMLLTYSQKEHDISLLDTDGKMVFKNLWHGADSNPEALRKTYLDCLNILDSSKAFAADSGRAEELVSNCLYVIKNKNAFANNSNVTNFMAIVPQLDSYEKNLSALGVDFEKLREPDDMLSTAHNKIISAKNNLSSLKAWTTLTRLCDEAREKGLEQVVDTYLSGKISDIDLIPAYDCCISFACAVNTINSSSALSRFHGVQFENTIKKFTEEMNKFENLTKQEIKARLMARLPDITKGTTSSSEVGILLKAIKNNGRMMSIRSLFDKIPTLLHRIAPCMLMSPISAAQYIDPAYPKFDIVMFDEASQLPTSEAVGAISRGNCAVIAGDPKQLPPTSFFATNRVDEENYDKEDLESILDDCIAISMPQSHLLWHYRSRHESLIAYSNMKYYGNQLYTFPSPNDLVSEVKFIPVPGGVYDRGGTKQNRAEAEAIVNEVIRRLKDRNLRKDSIGIVTFNINQQNLIEDLLMDKLREHPLLEKYAFGGEEPLFVKNLENVQGDERDVIMFSICYGPDKNGNITLNFGPLNQTGGWRRLNVAITRAKKSMIVFSTLRPEQINLSRTSSEGIEGLKGFLEFAQKGENSLSYGEKSDTAIIQMENIICSEIEKMGYSYKAKIGTSKYKVDIGVIDPVDPDRYVLGILLDGNTYRDAKSARDRNILQPSVLKGLGWNLYRMWILDWLDSPEKETEKLKAAIEDAIKKEEEKRKEAARKAQEETEEPEEIIEEAPAEEESAADEAPVENIPSEEPAKEPEKVEIPAEKTAPVQNSGESVYKSSEVTVLGKADEFYMEKTLPKIKKRMEEIIEAEAPVSRKILFKKTLSSWGMRSSQKAENLLTQISEILPCEKTQANNTAFFWKKGQEPAGYEEFRIPADEASKRTMDDIPPEEVASAIRSILENQLSMPRTDLIKETAKVFGFTRLGNVIEASVENGIEKALSRGYINISEDRDKISINS